MAYTDASADDIRDTPRLSAFIRDPDGGKPPVTVTAPIVTDARTGAQPLLDLVHSLQQNDTVAVAIAESERLAPYLAGLSLYLTEAIPAFAPEGDANGETLKKLVAPGGLSTLFNAMAERCHNTIISEVAILPNNIKSVGPARFLFGRGEFRAHYEYRGTLFTFGFLQIYENGDPQNASYSNLFPYFMLCSARMKAVEPHQSQALLRDFQQVMSMVNHDPLHHFTASIINPATVAKFDGKHAVNGDTDHLLDWFSKLPWQGILPLYEDWAQIAHEKILLAPGNEHMVAAVAGAMDRYFGELERIRDAMIRAGGPGEDNLDKTRDAVDYFGMVMAHAVTRVFPLNHPVMARCIGHMERIDPAPGDVLMDCVEADLVGGGDPVRRDLPVAVVMDYVREKIQYLRDMQPIINDYRALGLDLLPADDKVSYKQLKLLQLSRVSTREVVAHIPRPTARAMAELRAGIGETTLKMAVAAAGTANYTPS